MGINYSVIYHEAVSKEISGIPAVWRKKIQKAVEEKLQTCPDIFGKPLRQSLAGYRSIRIGDYRVVFRIEKKTVKIFAIQHRSIVYTTLNKRIS